MIDHTGVNMTDFAKSRAFSPAPFRVASRSQLAA
jgi:hypothetical protein